jgi:hypothetical protein
MHSCLLAKESQSAAMRSYFEPNRLELWGERSIYELLGVRFFKRYLLPTELLVNRLRGGTAMQGGQDVLKVELKRLEWETKRNEVIHLLALLLITCILLVKSPQLSAMRFPPLWSWCSPDVHGQPEQKEVVDRNTRVMKVCHCVPQDVPRIELRRTRIYRTINFLGGSGFFGTA